MWGLNSVYMSPSFFPASIWTCPYRRHAFVCVNAVATGSISDKEAKRDISIPHADLPNNASTSAGHSVHH
jgi:hypothetical protein